MKKISLLILPLLIGCRILFCQDITRHQADSMLIKSRATNDPRERMELLLNVAQFHIFKPGENPVDFDSAMVFINQAEALSKSVKSPTSEGYLLLTKAYMAREEKQNDIGKELLEKSIRILEKGNNKSYLGRALFELGSYYGFFEPIKVAERIALTKRSTKVFEQSGDLLGKARCLEMLAELAMNRGQINYDDKISYLQEALAIYDSLNFRKVQRVYILLGKLNRLNEDFGKGLLYSLKALKTATVFNDTSKQLCQINNELGVLYATIGRDDLATKYYINSLATASKHRDADDVVCVAGNLSLAYLELNQNKKALATLASIPTEYYNRNAPRERLLPIYNSFIAAYLGLKQLDSASRYVNEALLLVKDSIDSADKRHSSFRLMATYFLYKNQYSNVRYYLGKAEKLNALLPSQTAIRLTEQLRYQLDSAEGNFQSAFLHLQNYKSITDSINSERTARRFQVMNVEYEVEMKEDSIRMKDKDIAMLQEKTLMQQMNISQSNFIRNITIAATILAAIVIALLYRQYQQKQQSNIIVTQKNNQLQHLLNDKEWLLKEIHHRVKNNLQIVMSLLNSQSVYIDNEPALRAIQDSQHRVNAMALIHQKLYGSENVSTINIAAYVRELVSYLADSFDTGGRIRFDYLLEPLEMDASQAVPLGLILNEAVTNSIKYAFPGERPGVISISLSHTMGTQYLLRISDNGIGISIDRNNKKPGSLGTSLMKGLSEDLDGSFSIESNNGTTVKILFVFDPGFKRVASAASLISDN